MFLIRNIKVDVLIVVSSPKTQLESIWILMSNESSPYLSRRLNPKFLASYNYIFDSFMTVYFKISGKCTGYHYTNVDLWFYCLMKENKRQNLWGLCVKVNQLKVKCISIFSCHAIMIINSEFKQLIQGHNLFFYFFLFLVNRNFQLSKHKPLKLSACEKKMNN